MLSKKKKIYLAPGWGGETYRGMTHASPQIFVVSNSMYFILGTQRFLYQAAILYI